MNDVTKDLLEALRDLVSRSEKQGRSGAYYDKARAAIARADRFKVDGSEPSQPVLTPEQIEKADEAICEALRDAYDCGRVWFAWSYGTMGPEDFCQVSEDPERVAEIRNAAAAALGFKVD